MQKIYYNIGCKCIVVGCFYLRITINTIGIENLKCKESFKIIEKLHLNRQSDMIFACSLCIFLMLFLALVAAIFQFCRDCWFNAHAVTIGSMFIYKLGVTSLRGRSSVHC